jgi:hypothetical protein
VSQADRTNAVSATIAVSAFQQDGAAVLAWLLHDRRRASCLTNTLPKMDLPCSPCVPTWRRAQSVSTGSTGAVKG